jgi:hypothetical protein
LAYKKSRSSTGLVIIAITTVILVIAPFNGHARLEGIIKITNTSNTTTLAALVHPSAAKCNLSLWKFVANPPGRFKILSQCVSVTGTILSIHYEPDGDTDFPLALDAPYKNMVTKANFNPLMHGGIWSEMVCQHTEQSFAVESFKRGECIGYNGPIFNTPQVGQHLQVNGTYLLDIREGGHAEIHPVSSIKLIK